MYESKYPDYPDLTTDDARAELAAVWASRDPSSPLWQAAVLNEFQRAVAAGDAIDPWVLRFLHTQLHWVLSGAAWDDAFRLPNRSIPDEWNILSPKQQRDMELFIGAAKKIESGEKTTDAIAEVAREGNTSFETARAAFYAWGRKVDWRRKNSKK